MGFRNCHLYFVCDKMRFFLFSLFLLLLFDSPQGSTLPSKRSLGELNTTLKTNIDGTCQRINPCTKKEIQSTSCVGSHEFIHHVSGENWSDYSQKCSAIIKSFLQAIGNLIRFDCTPNGTCNFHVNTSVTHKQDGHCDSKESQSRRPIPTIIIEATGYEIPPPSCCQKEKNTQINTSQQQNSGRNPNLTSQGENTSSSGYSKITQEVTEITEIPAQDRPPKAGRFQGKNVTPTRTVQLVLPFVPQRATTETTKTEVSKETFTQISDKNVPPNTPTQPSTNYMTTPLILPPEEKFTSPAPPPPDTFVLGNPSGFAPNTPEERGFVPQRIPQTTTVDYEDQFIPNQYQTAPVGMDQPNDNSKQLFNDELGGQAPVNQQSANSFLSPDQIPVTNLPSTDSSNAFTDETQLERPLAYPVASSLGEPQNVELPFSKIPLPRRAPTAGPPAPNYPRHFPNQLRMTTPFPPTMVKPEFDELPGQGLVTRPPLTENNFFNGPGKPFPHDQRPELPTLLPPTQTPVINTDYEANKGSQGLTKQTFPINQPAHPEHVAFVPKDSTKFSAVNNTNRPNRPRVFHDNQPASRILQPHQQFATEAVDMKRFPTNTLPKPAFGPNFREKPGTSHPLNPFEQLATPKAQTPPPQITASTQTPSEPFPQPTAYLDIPPPQPTLPYEEKPLTTPAPELHSSVEETYNRDLEMPNSDYINPRIPAPFTRPEPQLKPSVQFPPNVLPQQATGQLSNAQLPQTTTPEPLTTDAPELTSLFDYDYQYPNYEVVDYDYPAHQSPNSTSKQPENPRGFVYRQFYPRAHAPFRKFLRHHPMRNTQMRHHPHIRKHTNNKKFINTTMPEYQPEYEYQYMDEVAPEQMRDYDYIDYPQFPVNAPHRRFPPHFHPRRHRVRNLKRKPLPQLGKSFEGGIPTSVERTPLHVLNPLLQHNRSNGRQNSDFINPPRIPAEPEIQFNGAPEEFQIVQPGLTNTTYENETITTEFQTTVEPEQQLPLKPVHQNTEGIQLDRREQQPPEFSPQSELQAPTGQTNFEAAQPQPMVRKFENETISADFQTTTGPHYQPPVEFNNQNIRGSSVGQMHPSYNPGHQVPNGFSQSGQSFRGGAHFHRGFPVHQQPIRNFRPVFPPENKSEFQSTEKPEFGNQFINRRNPEQVSNSHIAGQVPNTFNQPQPQLRGNAFALPPVGWTSSGKHPPRNLEIGPNHPALENDLPVTVQPEFQPDQDSRNTEDRRVEKVPDSQFTVRPVEDTFESPAKVNETIPVEQQQNFAINQPGFTTYENETVTTEFQTAVTPEYQLPVETINEHTDEKQILPSPVSSFRGHETPNLGQPELLMSHRPGQNFPLKQQPMNFGFPQSHHSSEEKTISRDFQSGNEHQPHDSRHIGNRWTGQRPNFQFRGQQIPNIFPQPGQQFGGGVPFPPSFSAKQQPMRILENAQPHFTTAAYEDVTTAAPEHQASLEPHQSIEQQTQETENLGPESDSQITKSPSGEFPSASSSNQGQERNFQISQPRPISDRTYEEETFRTTPATSHENVNDRAVSDLEQQNQNNFDQLSAPSRQFPPNISPQQSMETSETLQPNPPAQPIPVQTRVEYNRGKSSFPFRSPQNPRPFLQPNFQARPKPPFHEFPPNFYPQQHPIRNIQMGPSRRIHKNETIMTEFQETKPETQNYENDFPNDRKPDLPNLDFINQQNPKAFGIPESPVRAHFHRFPPGMHQVDRHNGPPFVKRPPMEFPPTRGLGRIPESVPGPFSDTRNRFVNPPNKNQPVVNRNNFQPETALMHSDRNLDYDIPTSFYNSRPTPNENQPEPQPDLIPGVRTSDEYLSATSSEETNTTSPPLPNTSVDYEDEENVPSVVSPYPGQVLNDNVTTPKANTSAFYPEQIAPVINSPRWQPSADISSSEYNQPPLTRPNPLEVISKSVSKEQDFGGDQPLVIPVRKEFPSDFNANPDGNPARAGVTPDIHEKPIERNNPVSMPQSNSFVPRDSTSAFSFQQQNQQFLNTPGNRPLVNLGTTPLPHISTTKTTFEQITESYGSGNIPPKSLTNPQRISVAGLQKLSPESLSPAARSNQLPRAIENPITNQPLGPPQDFLAPVGQVKVPPVSRPSIPTPFNFNQPEPQKSFEKQNLHVDRPHPPALGPPNHPTPSSQPVVPIYQQQHNQLHHAQRTPEGNFNAEEQLPQRKLGVHQQISGIPPVNRHSDSKQPAEVQKMALEQPKRDAIGTTAFPPQFQPQDVPFSQLNRDDFNSLMPLPSVNQQTKAIHLDQQSPIQISQPQANSFIQAGSAESQSLISANDQQPPVDFNLQKTPFKPIPAVSPQLPQPPTVVKPKTSNQQQFDVHQLTTKFPQTPSPKLTTTTYEEVTTTTDYPQSTYHSGIPVQLLKSTVNAPTRFSDTPRQVENPDFVSGLPPVVTEATSSQVSSPYVDETNPTFQKNSDSQYAHDKFNFPPPVAEPQPQPSFAHTASQNYKTMDRPILKLKPKTLAIADSHNQEDFPNPENSNRQFQSNLNIPPPTPSPRDQQYTAATSLKTSEMPYNPIASLHEKHDRQPVQDSLKFIDNSPQTQPTTAVKYSEKIQTAEYEPSPIPRPQPQTALNNSGRQTEDNSAYIWADQQQQITSPPDFGITPPISYDRVPPRNLKNIHTQPQLPPQHTDIDSQNHYTPQTHKSKTTETYEQEIITTNTPHRQTPQPVLILGDKVSSRGNPIYNRFTAPPPRSLRHETALNPNQQIAAATGGGHAAPEIAESQSTTPKYQTTLDHPAPVPPPEFIYSGKDLRKPQADSLVLVPLSQEHPNSETTEEVFVIQKTPTVPPPKQSVTKIPDAVSAEQKSFAGNSPIKTKIVEEIVTTELPKNIVNSPISTQLAFADKLLNYENKKLSNLQQVKNPHTVVENYYSSTPPSGSSPNSEQISNRFGGNAFPKNFERDNEQFEGSSVPNRVSTSTPQRSQQDILDNPTSSFDDYDPQHSTRSPDMFPEYDEIPPNFNARTDLTRGHSHVTFPMQPSAALPQLNSRWTTPMPNDPLAYKTRNEPDQHAKPGFLPSTSTQEEEDDNKSMLDDIKVGNYRITKAADQDRVLRRLLRDV